MPLAPPVPASTVIILRPSSARAPAPFEVFLVKRPDKASFMARAHVFPGGRVDEDDGRAAWVPACDGLDSLARRMGETPETALRYGVAAIRETFEEAGVLLVRTSSGEFPASVESAGARGRPGSPAGHATSDFLDLCLARGWRPALDLLAPWSRWVTPDFEPRRFDARFFVAVSPPRQAASHDGGETVASDWLSPRAALARHDAEELVLAPPTYRTLEQLARCASLEAVLAAAPHRSLAPVLPALHEEAGRRWLLLPGDPSYPPTDTPPCEAPTRFLLTGTRLRPA